MATQYLSKAGLTKLWGIISTTFVAKEDGKGLFSGSYNDLTDKPTKLSEFTNDLDFLSKTDIEAGYVKKEEGKGLFSGSYNDLTNKPENLSDFTNDLDFISATDISTTYVKKTDYDTKVAALEKADTDNLQAAKDYTDAAVGAITGFDFQIVESLPAEGSKGIIYLVATKEGDNVVADQNVYNEYIWITSGERGSFELIGTTKMDLTGYLKEVDIEVITDEEIDQICGVSSTP